MSVAFQITPRAAEDLDAIWWFIAEENRDAADRVELEIVATCGRLAKHPRIGTKRQDITALPVRFWTVTKFPITLSCTGRIPLRCRWSRCYMGNAI
jgi:plasmid stabilization system protein ParE